MSIAEFNILSRINKSDFTLFPKMIRVNPTQSDYDRGWYYRYFLRKTNDPNGEIIETDEREYSKFVDNSFFIKVRLKWNITAPASYTDNDGAIILNSKEIEQASELMPSLPKVIPNVIQYHREGGVIKYDNRKQRS